MYCFYNTSTDVGKIKIFVVLIEICVENLFPD